MMKKAILAALVLSLLLAVLTACGAEAQPTTPEPAPKIEEPTKPEPLAASEKVEISQEELEPIFEKVFTEASGNHPEDWSIDFQITDEIGKITKVIPEDKEAPSNLREIYTEWRAAKTEPDTAEPEPEPIPEPEPEPIPEPEPEPAAQQPQTQPPTQGQETLSSSGSSNSLTPSSTVQETPSEAPTTSTNNSGDISTTYPAGTTVQLGNTTYTSTGIIANASGWTLFTAADGSSIIVSKSGTKTPCLPDNELTNLDLSDGGQAEAEAGNFGHYDFGDQEHDFCGES